MPRNATFSAMSPTQVFTISVLEFAPAATRAFRRRMALARSKEKTAKLAPPKFERREQASQMATQFRRFPPPWSIEDIGAAFIVKGQRRPKARLFLL